MISFELHFQVESDKQAQFERTFAEVFAPAISRQQGFGSLKLLRQYSSVITDEIAATGSDYQYQITFTFESEAARRVWATSADHDLAWPKLSALSTKLFWRGYDLLAAQ